MAQAPKRRRIGQIRNSGFASLHPQAHDTRAEGEKVEALEGDVNAPPLSSSDEDSIVSEPNKDRPKSSSDSIKSITAKPSTEPSLNDSPFHQTFSQRRTKATYGRSKSSSKGAPVTSQGSKHPSTKKGAAETLKTSKDGISTRKEFRPPADISISRKKSTFHVPAAVTIVPTRATFRTPSIIEPTPPKVPSFRMPSGSAKDLEQLFATPSSQDNATTCAGSTPATQLASSQPQQITSSNTTASITASPTDAERDMSPDTFATCPICRAPLSEEALDTFESTLKGLSVKARYHRQAAFCRAHREAEARHTWTERGYPTIDWTILPSRLEPYRTALIDVLEKRRASHFRDQLQVKVDARRVAGLHTGRDTLAQEFEREDDGAESVGYYGGRGAQIMMNWLATSLAEPLRAARDTDALLKACGSVSAFVQQVLLPELATLLVVDDMRISKGKAPKARRLKPPVTTAEAQAARRRLAESAELGRLLCLDVDDDIMAEDEEGEDKNGGCGSGEEESDADEE